MTIKVLHTADWHLGQKFQNNDREQEHQMALDWLLETIIKEKIELLIVSGDIFDIGNPPNYAQKLYYNFLKGLLDTPCQNTIIIAGNHDSPSMLAAPKVLLSALNVHVLSHVTEDIGEELLLIKNAKKETIALVAAVPFLRDRDIIKSIASENGLARELRVKEGIVNHYKSVVEAAEAAYSPLLSQIPFIATGHLYAKGAQSSGKQDNIYVGNMDNIEAAQFPKKFDYIALGHIHRPQVVDKRDHIRYAGSLIPLSFSEILDEKSVTIISFDKKTIKNIEQIKIPIFRKLKKIIAYSLDEAKEKLKKEHEKSLVRMNSNPNFLTTWLEVEVDTDYIIPNLDMQLRDYTKDMKIDILKVTKKRNFIPIDVLTEEIIALKDMDEIDVFEKRCESLGHKSEEIELLKSAFIELKSGIARGD